MKTHVTLELLALEAALEKQAGLGSLLWGGAKMLGTGVKWGGKGLWAGTKLALKSPIYAYKGLQGFGTLARNHPLPVVGGILGLNVATGMMKPQELSGPTTFDGRITAPLPTMEPQRPYFDMTRGKGWSPS